jgi:hypothetical protein
MALSEDVIWVITSDGQNIQNTESPYRGIHEIKDSIVRKGLSIPVEDFKSNFNQFFKTVSGLIGSMPEGNLPYAIDEIEISAEISAEGKFQLIGGIGIGAKGGITFKLKRAKKDD